VRGRVVDARAFFELDALIAGVGFTVAAGGPPDGVRDAFREGGAAPARRLQMAAGGRGGFGALGAVETVWDGRAGHRSLRALRE